MEVKLQALHTIKDILAQRIDKLQRMGFIQMQTTETTHSTEQMIDLNKVYGYLDRLRNNETTKESIRPQTPWEDSLWL